jgi:hypothetical protein
MPKPSITEQPPQRGPMSRIEAIGSRFAEFHKNGNGYVACCPAHDDNKPSLSLKEGDKGGILVKCFAGCATEDVLAAAGLSMGDLMPNARLEVATYSYHDAAGKLRHETVRYDPKEFRQRRPDGRGGWVWNLQGVDRVPYRLRQLRRADRSKFVFLPEGEKAAERLAAEGLVSTAIVGGANAPWLDSYTAEFKDRHVVLLPDNDDPGRKRVHRFAAKLAGTAKSVRILDGLTLPPKGDVFDWFEAGGTAAELLELAKAAPIFNPSASTSPSKGEQNNAGAVKIDALELKAEETTPEIESLPLLGARGYVLKGLATILSAPPKAGKTELTYNSLADWIKAGEAVLYITEEPRPVWKLRLRAPDIIDRPGLRFVFGLGVPVDELLDLARAGDETVVIIDTLRGVGVLGEDENDNGAVVRALEPWQVLCREKNKTFLGLAHDRKAGGKYGHGVSGAHSLVGAVDMLLQLQRGGNDCQRTITALGRLVQPEPLTYERKDDGTMGLVEPTENPQPVTKAPTNILDFLPKQPPGVAIDDLIATAKVSKQLALLTLSIHVREESVRKSGSGKRGDPFLYYRVR